MVTLRDYHLGAIVAVEQHWISGGTAALQQIILGTIQTLFRDAHLLGRCDLFLIYEVQLPLHEAGFEPRIVRNRHWKITWADRSARTRVLVVAFTPDDRRARVQSRATLRRLLAS